MFEQEIYRQLEALKVQQQSNHDQALDLLRGIILSASSSPTSIVPASPTSPPHPPTDFNSLFSPSTAQATPTVILFFDVSWPETSILPPTPPTSLVSPPPQLGLMLSTPFTSIPPPIPFHPSPSSTSIIDLTDTSSPPFFPIDISLFFLHVNLSRHPFTGILPSASIKVFLVPQPLHFIPSPSTTSIYTLALLPPLSHVPPIATLPPLPSLLPPSPSSLPHPSSLTFTLRQASSSSYIADPTFSLTNPSTTTSSHLLSSAY